VDRWHVPSIDATGKREPRVLFSSQACRAVVIDLHAGETMGEHSVHEHAVLQVATGRIEVGGAGGSADCPAGTLVAFDPGERHSIRAVEASRLLLILAPWPGQGHYQDGEKEHPPFSVPPIG
jgi:quercetin dioxygenase-like cupin family protein